LDQQLARIEQALLKGATANGCIGEVWSLARIATVIERLTGVRHHPRARVGGAAPPAALDGYQPASVAIMLRRRRRHVEPGAVISRWAIAAASGCPVAAS
jgi:hypothetical protein